jgi:hypothetical protein
MDEQTIVGRSFGSDTTAIKNEEGDWEVTCRMIEKMLMSGETEWKEKIIATKYIDASFEKAYGIAMSATLEKFEQEVEKTKSDSLFVAPEKTELLQ